MQPEASTVQDDSLTSKLSGFFTRGKGKKKNAGATPEGQAKESCASLTVDELKSKKILYLKVDELYELHVHVCVFLCVHIHE